MGFQLTTQNDFDLEKWLPSSNSGIYEGPAFLKFGINDKYTKHMSWSCRHPGGHSTHGDLRFNGFQVSGGGPFEGLVFCGKLCDGTRSFDPGDFGGFCWGILIFLAVYI